MKFIFTALLVMLSATASAQSTYKYAGPFVVDAVKSNEGVLEMTVPRGGTVGIVFKGCDRAKVVDDGRVSFLTSKIYTDGMSVTIKNGFGSTTKGAFPVNIVTAQGLMHTIVLIPAPKDYKASDLQLKAVIESSSDCKA